MEYISNFDGGSRAEPIFIWDKGSRVGVFCAPASQGFYVYWGKGVVGGVGVEVDPTKVVNIIDWWKGAARQK
jgi:hypothetical protein